MICDLCKEDSVQIIRVASWQVCQWCIGNHVLEHALEVEIHIAKLREAVAQTSAMHQRDVRNEAAARTELELAYSAYDGLATAREAFETSTIKSKKSLRLELNAQQMLDDYKTKERRRTQRARKHS